jgi:hypothetical protein
VEPESSLPCSQDPGTGPYPEPHASSPHFPYSISLILTYHLCLCLPNGLFPWGFANNILYLHIQVEYEGVSKGFRTGRLQQELQMIQLSATRCSCIATLWVSLVSFAAIILYVASQRVFIIVIVYFVIESVRKLLDTPSYINRSTYVSVIVFNISLYLIFS